ncbi:MAG: hypothetical protein ACL93V_02190 [Candidatus Electrothrix sp. YB6]
MDFAAVTDHWTSLGSEGYRILKQWAEQANRPGVFVALLADERNPKELNGHHNVYLPEIGTMERYQAAHDEYNGDSENDAAPPNSFSRLQDAEASAMP